MIGIGGQPPSSDFAAANKKSEARKDSEAEGEKDERRRRGVVKVDEQDPPHPTENVRDAKVHWMPRFLSARLSPHEGQMHHTSTRSLLQPLATMFISSQRRREAIDTRDLLQQPNERIQSPTEAASGEDPADGGGGTQQQQQQRRPWRFLGILVSFFFLFLLVP